MAHQGDGLEIHFITDREGEAAICGYKIEYYDKKVSRVDEPISLFILAGTGRIYQRCVQQSGLDKEIQ